MDWLCVDVEKAPALPGIRGAVTGRVHAFNSFLKTEMVFYR